MTDKQKQLEEILNKPISEVVKLMDEQLLLSLWAVAFETGYQLGQQIAHKTINEAIKIEINKN